MLTGEFVFSFCRRNASGSQSLLALAAAAEEVQKKKKKKEPIISPELSKLINYCQSVKFPGILIKSIRRGGKMYQDFGVSKL